jgi:hypothetical protein
MRQQKYLENHVLASYQPIYRKEANRKEGEIFPVVWYSSNLQMTSMQQALMARSVLTAEDPSLRYARPPPFFSRLLFPSGF